MEISSNIDHIYNVKRSLKGKFSYQTLFQVTVQLSDKLFTQVSSANNKYEIGVFLEINSMKMLVMTYWKCNRK